MKLLNRVDFLVWLKQPMVIVSIVLSVIWCLSDIVGRLSYNLDLNNVELSETDYESISQTKLSDSDVETIHQLFTPFFPESEAQEPQSEESERLTEAQQAAQQGELDEVYIEDKKLQLKAVIVRPPQQLTALINVVNVVTGEQKLESFTNTNKIYGFDLEIINNSQVQLTMQRDDRLQKITLSMFNLTTNTERSKAKK